VAAVAGTAADLVAAGTVAAVTVESRQGD